MKKNIRGLIAFLAVCISTMIFSCNNSGESKKETSTATEDTVIASNPSPAAFTPFDVMDIAHSVKNYGNWRPAFDTDAVNRKAAGMEDIRVGHLAGDPNNIRIAFKVSDINKAKQFIADPKLKDIMEKAGVTSKPEFEFFHVIRFNPDSREKQWVLITHRVKDFDAWVKVYDSEGVVQRASEGMTDLALARGVDDPNIVRVVLDITDMAKAKAALSSDAKKKLMESAGVEGKPRIEFYSAAE